MASLAFPTAAGSDLNPNDLPGKSEEKNQKPSDSWGEGIGSWKWGRMTENSNTSVVSFSSAER